MRRTITTTTTSYYLPEPAKETEPSSEETLPSAAGSLVGTLLSVAAGAAVGAALTYTMVRQDRSRVPEHMADHGPVLLRRATFPEKAYYADQAPGDTSPWAPSGTIAGYDCRARPSRARESEDVVFGSESRDRRYSLSHPSSSRARSGSETEARRRPLLLAATEYRSQAGTEHGSLAHCKRRPRVQDSHASSMPERASYVSARSHLSSAGGHTLPIRPYKPASCARSAASRSYTVRPPSRANTAVTEHRVTMAPNFGGSYISAQHARGPSSRVDDQAVECSAAGGGGGGNDDDDDGSIVPSDSISNVASRYDGRRAVGTN